MTDDKAGFGAVNKRLTAYVVFQGDVGVNAPIPFTEAGWRHCWVILPVFFPEPGLMAQTYAEKIEFLRWGMDTAVWWREPEIVAGAFLKHRSVTAVIEYPFTVPAPEPRYVRRGLMTCVTLTKAVLQIDDWKVWTPRQLFAYLVRHGGRRHNP